MTRKQPPARKGVPAEAAAADIEPVGRRSARLRLRAAWMYYVEEMTQNAIAEALGIGRVTVVRLLADARALHEVKITLSREVADLPRIEIALEKAFGLEEAVVAPISSPDADPTAAISAATGQFVSDFVQPGMTLGVGWGRTLLKALSFINDRPVANLTVVSLLGGLGKVRQYNPAEFAWQFARLFQAECWMIAAPALVDSVETRRALIERCGVGEVLDLADRLDAVLVSVGQTAASGTAYHYGFFSEADRRSLVERGAVGDVLYSFFDIEGRLVDHSINERIMGASVEQIAKAPHRILTSGGLDKLEAIRGAMRLVKPTVFITDEVTAAALLAAEEEVGADRRRA